MNIIFNITNTKLLQIKIMLFIEVLFLQYLYYENLSGNVVYTYGV